jgi:hypothetical protein
VDPATLTRGIDLDIVSGRLADLQPGAMAVSRDVARAHAWSVGSTVSVQLERGSSELRVAAAYDTVTDVGGVPLGNITIGNHLLATEDFQRLSGNRRAAWIYVTAADDVAPDRARAVIEQAADAGSNLVIRDRPTLRRELLGQLNDAVQVYGALLGLDPMGGDRRHGHRRRGRRGAGHLLRLGRGEGIHPVGRRRVPPPRSVTSHSRSF